MTIQDNKVLAQRFFDAAFVRHDLNEAVKLLAPDYRLHDAAFPDFSGGPEGWRKMQQPLIDSFTNHRCQVLKQTCEGDLVTTQWRTTGTHSKEMFGIAPTNRKIDVEGFTLSRLVNGKIAEEWQVWDRLGLMEQLGVVDMSRFRRVA